MNEQRNMYLAIVLSIAILLGWQFFFDKPKPVPPAVQTQQKAEVGGPLVPEEGNTPSVPGVPAAASTSKASAEGPRIRVETPEIKGSIALMGARIDSLDLLKYHETPDPTSPEVQLLSPATGDGAYYAEFGWVPTDGKIVVPQGDTVWNADGDNVSPGHPVRLTWDNGQGLRFTRIYAVDQASMFTVTQKVENTTDATVVLHPYVLISRWGTPHTLDTYVLHEGPLGVFNGTLKDSVKYKDLREKDHVIEEKTKGGWIGFTDKYWLTALIPDQEEEYQTRMSWRSADNLDRYQVDWLGKALTLAPQQQVEHSSHFFAGAKELAQLDTYREHLSVPLFDRSIDFGWFWFLTIPFFHFLRFIHAHVPNFGITIMVFTVVIKGLFFPLANKSYRAMSKMKKLQPEIAKLQQKYGDDKAKLNQEMMALYKREKASPVSGCLPLVIQIPVFFALYKVLYVTLEMRQAPFFGWIKDLSVPDPTTLFNLFGLIPWTPPMFLHIGVWPLIMGVTMWLQQKLNPQPTDPTQAKMFTFLPLIFTFMLASFPAGLVIYWAWSNVLSIGQQWLIMRQVNKA